MPLLFAIALIVTILIFIVFRDNLSALACSEQKSNEKTKEYGYGFTKDKKLKEQNNKVSHIKTRQCRQRVLSDTWFPKHKTDPRLFVDDEEIGQEPIV